MKIPTPLTPYLETIKLVLAVLVGCALLWGGQKVLSWREAAALSEQQGRTAGATVGISQDGAKADADRVATDTGVRQGRDQFNQTYDEANRHEPETAARSDRAVPVRVRDAFRERRLARQRLGCVGEQCEPGPEADAPAERP